METQGYEDIENERKAKRIREIRREINKGDEDDKLFKEAEILSDELKNYLLRTYPDKFNIKILYPQWHEYDKIMKDWYNKNFKNTMDEYNLKIHDVIFFIRGGEGGSGEYTVTSGFLDEDGLHLGTPFYFRTGSGYPDVEYIKIKVKTIGPKEWYEFLERMALLPETAAKLYKRNNENVRPFYESKSYNWPYITTNKDENKL